MMLFVFATRMEATPFLKKISGALETEKPFRVYKAQAPFSRGRVKVIVSGMGKVYAAAAAAYALSRYDVSHVVNAGICGSLSRNLQVGDVFCVETAVEGDHHVFTKPVAPLPCALYLWKDLTKARLVTNDIPVFDEHGKAASVRHGDLVDMEGAAVAKVCAMFEKPFTLIKGVTDFADPEGRKTIEKNMKQVSAKIADILVQGLNGKVWDCITPKNF